MNHTRFHGIRELFSERLNTIEIFIDLRYMEYLPINVDFESMAPKYGYDYIGSVEPSLRNILEHAQFEWNIPYDYRDTI